MTNLITERAALDASLIPYVTADEAATLLETETQRFLAVVTSLGPDDWAKPTPCTAWDVRDILAHTAGTYASGTGYGPMMGMSLQYLQYLTRPNSGQLGEDIVNANQLIKRADRTPAELIAEIRAAAPIANRKWAYRFRPIKLSRMPHPVFGLLSARHLLWVIHSRDAWMHRLDICRATGRPFEQTAAHDGRIVALVVRDVDPILAPKLGGRAVVYNLTGVAGGVWKIGVGEAKAGIEVDALDFNIYASGRFTYDEIRARAALSGDVALAELALRHTQALY